MSRQFFINQSNTKDREPYLCTTCKKVWQFTENHTYIDYVADFPKRGCTRKICRHCK